MTSIEASSGGPGSGAASFRWGSRLAPVAALVLYGAANVPFVYKYGARAGLPGWSLVLAYGGVVAALGVLAPRLARRLAARSDSGRLYAACVLIATASLAVVMSGFDPDAIRVTRAPAIHAWLERALRGEFPYASAVMPSAFPILFALALPFDRLGDVGWLQIAALPPFAALCWRASGALRHRAWMALGLLVAAPLFVYEVVTRSELFSNMTLLIAVLALLERRRLPLGALGVGILAGLVQSTRGIVGLGYVLFGCWRFRREPRLGLVLAATAAITFVATLVPFALWDPDRFARFGPFAIQTSYIPSWLIVAFAVVAAFLGWTARAAEQAYARIAMVMFAVVGVLFAQAVRDLGWSHLLLDDHFDISYFAFGHTTLLYGIARGAWGFDSSRDLSPGSGR